MPYRSIFAIASVATAALALSGCSLLPQAGPLTTEEREIDGVSAVVLSTSGDLTVTVGDSPSLTITAGENIIDRLTSETSNGELRLDASGSLPPASGDIRYELTLPLLEALALEGSGDADVDFSGARTVSVELSGSGDVEARGIDAETVDASIEGSGGIELGEIATELLDVQISGSGDIEASGMAAFQTVRISGSGEYSAEDLDSMDAEVTIEGAGDVDVHVTGSLVAVIEGTGTIRHTGGAEVDSRIEGTGDVIER